MDRGARDDSFFAHTKAAFDKAGQPRASWRPMSPGWTTDLEWRGGTRTPDLLVRNCCRTKNQ